MQSREAVTVAAMAPTVEEFIQAVLTCPDVYRPLTVTINHGPREHGQGRRSGGMVKGSMSAAPAGIRVYTNLFGNLPDYRKISKDFYPIPRPAFSRPHFYLKARDYGLDHTLARWFCIDPRTAHEKIYGSGAQNTPLPPSVGSGGCEP